MSRKLATVVILLAAPAMLIGDVVDFDTQVVPILSKAGCNAASCHGSAAGQAGFRLSLFGGDPDFDYRTIVREYGGRRLNISHPEASLLLRKPTGELEHGGGDVLDEESAQTLSQWIQEGARRPKLRSLSDIEVTPRELSSATIPYSQQLQVTAYFDDGTKRNVTSEAVYVSQNEAVLDVSTQGELTINGRGRQSVVVRFGNQVQLVSVTTPIGSKRTSLGPAFTNNWIDDEINGTLESLRLSAAPQANDAAFLRRVTLDLTGRLPTPNQAKEFLADRDSKKRSRVIDELVDSEEFDTYWTHQLTKILRLRVPSVDGQAAKAFHDWVAEQVAGDVGWDDMVRELILSDGDTHEVGPATVHRFFATGREEAEYMSEVFMGVRLRCANCHNHPLDSWTQDDYHGLSQVFASLRRGQVVSDTRRGNIIHPRTGTPATAKLPGDRFLKAEELPRSAFANWLTHEQGSQLSKAMSGRIWAILMGRGIVTPVDDLRATNSATHPALLERLSLFFEENEFQLKPLIRLICRSAAYQRSSRRPAGFPIDGQFYSYARRKGLSAEVLIDAIVDVTGVPKSDAGQNLRAIQVVNRAELSNQLEFLGQCLPSEGGCMGSAASRRGIASKLHLMNGELLNEKLAAKTSSLQKLLRAEKPIAEIVDSFYWLALNRPPTEKERTDWISRIGNDKEKKVERCEDFVWALLNCDEFVYNH